MPTSLNCPACILAFQLSNVEPGQTVKCPGCSGQFFVPPQTAHLSPPAIQKPKGVKSGVIAPTPTVVQRPTTTPKPSLLPRVTPVGSPAAASTKHWMTTGLGVAMCAGVMAAAVLMLGLLWWWMTSGPDLDPPNSPVVAQTTEEPSTKKKSPPRGPEKTTAKQNPGGSAKDEDAPTKRAGTKDDAPSDPPAGAAQDQTSPPPKKQEDINRLEMLPVDLGNLAKSDKLVFPLPPFNADESPTPETWDGHTNHIRGVAFNDDGTLVVSVSGDVGEVVADGKRRDPDNSIRVWDARRGKQVHKLDGFVEPLDGLSVSPGGRFALFGHGGHYEGKVFVAPKHSHVRMFDIQSKVEIPFGAGLDGKVEAAKVAEIWPRFQGLTGSVFCTAFSPDRKIVLGGSNKGSRHAL